MLGIKGKRLIGHADKKSSKKSALKVSIVKWNILLDFIFFYYILSKNAVFKGHISSFY